MRIRVLVGTMLTLLDLMVIATVGLGAAAKQPVSPNILFTALGFNLFGALIWWAAGRQDG